MASSIDSVVNTVTVSKDRAEWEINDATINFLLSMSEIAQNLDEDFSTTRTFSSSLNAYRSLSKNVFKRKLQNGQEVNRKYLCFSVSKKALFCIPCLLFGGRSSKFGSDGYTDWNNVNSGLNHHENSDEHMKCLTAFSIRSRTVGRIDSELQCQIQSEKNYWRSVLQRVLAFIKKLTSRGLALRGKDEKFGSRTNGNFMMSLELIAEFDPFLSKHIATYGNPGNGRTSYLSSTICDEFIHLLASKVTKTIIHEIKSSKYFSIVVDSTSDIGHIDQLSFIIRYVRQSGQPVERFLKFLPNIGHEAKDMEYAVTDTISAYGLNFEDCRGQSYDNAPNMSGCYEGLQAKILILCALALYVPCAAHSLNLVGTHAVETILTVSMFFDYLQDMYSFMVASTYRWEMLMETLKPNQKVVKRATGTRWSSRYNACSALLGGVERIPGNIGKNRK